MTKLALNEIIKLFKQELSGYMDNYEKESFYLIKHSLGVNDKDFLLDTYIDLDENKISILKEVFDKRKQKEPFAYIFKKKEFFSMEFFVDPTVLIPRPETELLVEIFIKENQMIPETLQGIEIGTGSACIVISIIKNMNNIGHIYACDISHRVIEIAQKNISTLLNPQLAKKITLIQSNLFRNLKSLVEKESIDFIISNPPYVLEEEYEKLDKEVFFEPKEALVVKDPSNFYYEFFRDAFEVLKENGKIYLESSPSLIPIQLELLEKFTIQNIKVSKDLQNLNRYLIITK